MPDDQSDDDFEEVCGEAYDHVLRLIDERDGMRTYECRNCGSELWEEDDDA